MAVKNTLTYIRYEDDFPFTEFTNVWTDTVRSTYAAEKLYVVQTSEKVVSRVLLMTTDPGDLVLDPTCGSGTTAYVAEQWGRRWITCDTSRVAITLAKQRLMTAIFDNRKTILMLVRMWLIAFVWRGCSRIIIKHFDLNFL